MTFGIFELAIIIAIATVFGVLAKLLKQPVILAYMAAGVVAGFFGFLSADNRSAFGVFSDLGIMFLLFLVGMEINYGSLRLIGRSALIIGVSQVVLTFGLGLLLAHYLGFSYLPAAYIAMALTFSSTIIAVRLLSEKNDLESLYGKLSIGLLLVQDFVAILLLIVVAGIGSGQSGVWLNVFFAVVKGIALFLLMLWLGRKIMPLLFDRIARSQELLFLASLAWVFVLGALARSIGFSVEIAGFLAGLALANSSEHFQIASRIRPLRDFFILVFFVVLGSSVAFLNIHGLIKPIITFSLFVLIGNPLIVLAIMGVLGYRKRTSFSSAVTIGQISEFSLILVSLGLKAGHIDYGVVSLVTAVGIITITLSSYLILHADRIFRRLSPALSVFERKKTKEEEHFSKTKKSIVLIGAHRVGESIARNLPKEDLLIIDYDPEVIHRLKNQGFEFLFGDVSDDEILKMANLAESKLVISTSPNLDDNLTLLNWVKHLPRHPQVVLRAENDKEARILYKEGADYVLLPHITAGQYLGKTIAIDPDAKILEQLKERDLALFEKESE